MKGFTRLNYLITKEAHEAFGEIQAEYMMRDRARPNKADTLSRLLIEFAKLLKKGTEAPKPKAPKATKTTATPPPTEVKIDELGDKFTAAQFYEYMTEGSRATKERRLKKLCDLGKIKRIGLGYYEKVS